MTISILSISMYMYTDIYRERAVKRQKRAEEIRPFKEDITNKYKFKQIIAGY